MSIASDNSGTIKKYPIHDQLMSNDQNKPMSSRYRPEIDGLRAFAVIAVIINHFNKNILPGGYLGVDIFFVISGYVITSSLYQRPSRDFKDFISGFYERRIKRLVPALSVFVVITSIIICLFNPNPRISLETGITSLFGLSNIYLLKQSTDYFASATELNVFTHTWSLGVEEQFYILFPFLIWFSGFGRQTKNGARNLFVAIGFLTITSLIGFINLYPINQSAAYFLMPTRFWEMAAGCLLFIGFQKRTSFENLLEKFPPLLILGLVISVMYLPMKFAIASTISIVILSSILIASLKRSTTGYIIFTNPTVVYIGLISYSLYLWHWSVLSISRWTIGIHWWTVPIQLFVMFALAIISYRFIETPLRKKTWFGKRWKTLITGVGVLGIVYLIIGAFNQNTLFKYIYTGKKGNTQKSCKPYQGNTCNPKDFPHYSTTPYITGTNIQRNNCFKYAGSITNEIINECTITPDENSSQTIFLVGSSFVAHQTPAFIPIREEFGTGISTLLVTACDLDLTFQEESKQGTCIESNKLRTEFLKTKASKGDIIYTGITGYRGEKGNIQKIADFARDNKIHVIYHTPIPRWTRLEPGKNSICAAGTDEWFRELSTLDCDEKSKIDRSLYDFYSKQTIEEINKAAAGNEYFHVFNIHEFLCDQDECPSHAKDIRIYRDNSGHLTVHYSNEVLSEKLRTYLLNEKLLHNKKVN